jgi:AraC-like DNA-binding protein
VHEPLTQPQALAAAPLGDGERARFFRAPRQHDLECLTARFREHVYAPHSHDTFVVGIIEAGCETYRLRGERHYAGPGDLCFVNPGDVHDGEPFGAGYAYRMTYPTVELLTELAGDLVERRPVGALHFPIGRVRDPILSAAFAAAHRTAEASGGALETDERLHRVFTALIARHAVGARAPRPGEIEERGPVARALAYLDTRFAEDVDLATLAAVADVPRTRLIRAMKRETGMTPHAWLTDRRVRAARTLLAGGLAPAEVAATCGFCDQSHLNRAFKARIGVTPGAFRRR